MKELSLANFKYGLDNRREALTSVLGTLVTCENAHINQGGEVEKRKAFYYITGFDVQDSRNNLAFHWIESTDAGLVLFGSSLPFGTAVTQGQSVNDAAPPVGYTYQQLAHPSILEGETYDGDLHEMFQVRWSKVFAGKAFVAVKFSDGNTFLYYDGALVEQSRAGRVLAGLASLSDLSTELAGQVNELDNWVGLANVDQNGVTQDGTTMVKSPIDIYFTPTTHFESVAGYLGSDLVDVDNPNVSEVKASAGFLLTRAADGTVELTAPANSNGTGVSALTGGPVSTAASDVLMAAKVVQAVNDLAYVHGYTAAVSGASITVYAPITWGASINTFLLTANFTGGMGTGGGPTPPVGLVATATPSPLNVVYHSATGSWAIVSGTITVSASGGTGPYVFHWIEFSGFDHSNEHQSSIVIKNRLDRGEQLNGVVKCQVTDSMAASVIVQISVHLEFAQI